MVICAALASLIWMIFLAAPDEAHAIDVSPARIEQTVQAGSTYNGTLTVTNSHPSEVRISVSPGEYRALLSNRTEPPKDPYLRTLPSCADWIRLEAREITVYPSQSIALNYTITVPPNWTRESLASIVFDKLPGEESQIGAGRVELIARFSIPVFLAIEGYEETRGETIIKEVRRSNRRGFLEIDSLLMNTGGRHFEATGTVAVFSRETGTLVGEEPTGRTLPVFAGFGEHFSIPLPLPSEGSYVATVTMDLGKEQIAQDKLPFQVTRTGLVQHAEDVHNQ